jgi:uncharacterized membrane protein
MVYDNISYAVRQVAHHIEENEMIRFENTIEIDRPIAEVFAYVGDLEHIPEWNWAVTATRKVSHGPIRVGTEYTQTRSVPKPATESLRITAFDSPEMIEIEGTLGPFPARVSYRLDEQDRVTTVINEVELETPGALALAAPVTSRRIRASVAENLRALKDLLEQPSSVRR